MPAPEVLPLLSAQVETSRDAYDTVRNADPHTWGGATRHRFALLNARLVWLRARTALAEALAAKRGSDA